MGSKSSPSARSIKTSLNVDRHVFVGRPRRLLLPRGVHDMAWMAGRPGGILVIWPAIRSHLSATMACNLRCPVRLSTSTDYTTATFAPYSHSPILYYVCPRWWTAKTMQGLWVKPYKPVLCPVPTHGTGYWLKKLHCTQCGWISPGQEKENNNATSLDTG